MMKIFASITGSFQSAAKLISSFLCCVAVAVLVFSSAAFGQPWQKGASVRLKAATDLNFKDSFSRRGEVGETFTVLLHNTETKRVFVEAKARDGSVIALNAPEAAFEAVPVDLVPILARVEGLVRGRDYRTAAQVVTSLKPNAPDLVGLDELIRRLGELAQNDAKVQQAVSRVTSARAEANRLRQNAQVAERPNRLKPGDASGAQRAAQMRQQAQELEDAASREVESAKTTLSDGIEQCTALVQQAKKEAGNFQTTQQASPKQMPSSESKEEPLASAERLRTEPNAAPEAFAVGNTSTPAYKEEATDLYPIVVEKRFGFIDSAGKIAVEPQFYWASDFADGLARAVTVQNGKVTYGYVNKTGAFAFKRYDQVQPEGSQYFEVTVTSGQFSEGLAWFIDTSGLAYGAWQKKRGYLDKSGKVTISARFADAGDFHDGLAPVKTEDGKWGYINKQGQFAIQAVFRGAKSFSQGIAEVSVEIDGNGRTRFIDVGGRFILPQANDKSILTAFSEGLLPIHREDCYIDRSGRVALKPSVRGFVGFLAAC